MRRFPSRLVIVDWCLTALSGQTGYIVPQEYEIYHVGPGTRQIHNEQYTKPKRS